MGVAALAVMLVLCLAVTGAMADGAVYEISTLEDLINFRESVNSGNNDNNKTVSLENDINLESVENWTPIGTKTNPFRGTFDGKNHTIRNLVITGTSNEVGLFGCTAANGSIQNLQIENALVSGKDAVGALVGSSGTAKISNIVLKGHVEVNGSTYVGGVLGQNAYGDVTDVEVDVRSDGAVRWRVRRIEEGAL